MRKKIKDQELEIRMRIDAWSAKKPFYVYTFFFFLEYLELLSRYDIYSCLFSRIIDQTLPARRI